MLKIKINDKPDCISVRQRYNDYSTLEGIVLLDIAIGILKEDFKLSDDDIWKLLKDYRENMKEVD